MCLQKYTLQTYPNFTTFFKQEYVFLPFLGDVEFPQSSHGFLFSDIIYLKVKIIKHNLYKKRARTVLVLVCLHLNRKWNLDDLIEENAARLMK